MEKARIGESGLYQITTEIIIKDYRIQLHFDDIEESEFGVIRDAAFRWYAQIMLLNGYSSNAITTWGDFGK